MSMMRRSSDFLFLFQIFGRAIILSCSSSKFWHTWREWWGWGEHQHRQSLQWLSWKHCDVVRKVQNCKPDIKSGLNHSITVSKGGNCFWFKQWFQMLNDSLCCWPGRCVQQVDRVQPAAPVTGIRTSLYRYSWLTGFSHQDQSQPIKVQQVGRF